MAKRLLHLYNKANKDFLSSAIDILIFLYIISVSNKNMLHLISSHNRVTIEWVMNKIKDDSVLHSISLNFFILSNIRRWLLLCYLLLPNLSFDVLHRRRVLRLIGGRKLLCLPISAKTRDSWNMRRKKVKKKKELVVS